MEAALAGMEKGEEAVVTIVPAHAYGDVGCPPRIPPRAHVQFLLRLLYIEWPTTVRRGTVAAHCAAAACPFGARSLLSFDGRVWRVHREA